MVSTEAIQDVARQYRADGYQVTVRPDVDKLPSFVAGRAIDILAVKGDQQVIVEVKETQQQLRSDTTFSRLVEMANTHPGWRVDLVVLNSDAIVESAPLKVVEPSIDATLHDLDQAEKSSQNGELSSAFIIAWSALESAMRRAARASGLEIKNISPSFLLNTLYANGLIERAAFDQLSAHLRLRNSLVHGLSAPQFSRDAVLYVTSAARKLLAEAEQANVATAS